MSSVLVLVGLPGSGKSTWARQQGCAVLSSDASRYLLIDDATDQSIHREAFALVRHLLRRRLELKRPLTIIDATNLTPGERRPYVRIAQMNGCDVGAVFFDVPLGLCRERNQARERVVPDEALQLMATRLIAPNLSEGFDRITISKGAALPPTGSLEAK